MAAEVSLVRRQISQRVPLCDVPRHFAGIRQSPYMMEYLTTILDLCPRGSRSLETGVGSGYGAVWLSLRGVLAEGIDLEPALVERARQVNNVLNGRAAFRRGDVFQLYNERKGGPRFAAIHHQGVLEHFPVPWIRSALAQQVALADWVVFSVPSVHYPFEPEDGDERLLPLEEWQRILAPFDVEELRYHGDPQHGQREHVLCILRGQKLTNQKVTSDLIRLMNVPEEPYPPGITVIIHTRNEERHIAECIGSVRGWADEILVCDMESEDATVAIAEGLIGAENIIRHPRIPNFDRARNVSAMRAKYRWVFYLDADERVPPALGARIRDMIAEQPNAPPPGFDGVLFPFRHHVCGQWFQSLYPGYTAPRLFKNGRFRFSARLHSGAEVDGPTILSAADDPGLAIVHFSYDSYAHYLDKLNRYTDGEAQNLHRDGHAFHWQTAIRDFVQDYQSYERRGMPQLDGVTGWVYTFHSAFYRFEQWAKLHELRLRHGQVQPHEQAVPASVEEMLEYALAVARHRPIPPPAPIRVSGETTATGRDIVRDIVWCAPLHDPSGYGEESRQYIFALDRALRDAPEIGRLAVQSIPWSYSEVDLLPGERELLDRLGEQEVAPGFAQVIHDFPSSMLTRRHPQAGVTVGHTVFETDRLPAEWVRALNEMDYVWVLSEFNRKTFADAGVDPRKLAVIPAAIDPGRYGALPDPGERVTEILRNQTGATETDSFTFLYICDWTLHKGWDVLLRAFLEEFPIGRPDESASAGGAQDVRLILKVWSTMNYSPERIEEQAAGYVRETLGQDLRADKRVQFVHDRLTRDELTNLFAGCDCYCMPSRGEGWGRPYMEAMACGTPVIATNWSGQTAYLNEANSYPVDCEVVPVPEAGWREIPTYRGHRWAEPSLAHLRERMRFVVENRDGAAQTGKRGREDVFARFNPETVGRQMVAELQRIAAPAPVEVHPSQVIPEEPSEPEGVVTVTPSNLIVRDRRSKAIPAKPAVAQPPPPVSVRWEGSFFVWHSLGHVNREIGLELLRSGDVDLSIAHVEPYQFAPHTEHRFRGLGDHVFRNLDRPADVHVRHFYPPGFNPPGEGHLVLMQPWEYGFLPSHWIGPIQTQVSEVWCYSQYVKDVYLASGIPEEKLKIVSLGVDTEVFRPGAPPYVFTQEAGAARWNRQRSADPDQSPFVFLFAGGTLDRKGIDILLDAYTRAFSAYDDVCLVIKDTCTKTVYQGQNMHSRILELAQDDSRPAIVYLDDDLTARQLAGLYTASDCLVQPYRGEGFCLPALEAMACGKPVIVPEGGPTDDFVDEGVGWRIRAEHKPGGVKVGPWFCVQPTWMFEVSPDDLARLMRKIFSNRAEAANRGRAATERAQEWTWRRTADVVRERMRVLQATPVAKKPGGRAFAGTSHAGGVPPARSIEGFVPPDTFVPPTGTHAVVQARANSDERQIEELKAAGGKLGETVSESPTLVSASPAAPADTATRKRGGNNRARQKGAASQGNAVVGQSVPGQTRTSPVRRARPTISLCIIARNEERCIRECLESAMPYVDQVVVVDTGSTDRTVEIAKECGAEVYHFVWCHSFSAARNESLRYATGDWCLWIDCDDVFPAQHGERLHDIVALAEDHVGGYFVKIDFPAAPGHTGRTVVDHLKLFRNDPNHRFTFRIHEQLLDSVYRNGYSVEPSDIWVVHKNYDHSPEGQKKKRERDMPLLLLDIKENPDHPFPWHNLGMTHFMDKDFVKAIPALERSLQLSGRDDSTVRKLYAMLAGSYEELRDLAQAKHWLEEGLRLFPWDPDLVFRGGRIYQELGDLAAAERCYLQLLHGYDQYQTDSYDIMITGCKARHNLALLYMDQGRLPDAEAQFRSAVADQTDFMPSWDALFGLLMQQRRTGEAQAVVSQVAQFSPADAERLHRQLLSMEGH